MKRIVAATLSLLCIHCSSGDLPDSFRLETFRVLALMADIPEANPGDTVTVTPLLSDVLGNGRTVTFSAQACIDPGVGFGATPACDGNPSSVTLATDQVVNGLIAPNYTGLASSTVAVPIPASPIIFDQRSTADQFNGVAYLVVFQFKVSATETVNAFKRILVSTRTTKHTNPTYTSPSIQSNGSPLAAISETETDINVDVNPASAESFQEMLADGNLVTKTEVPQTFWYISDGDLFTRLTENSDENRFTKPDTLPTNHQLVIVAVTVDERGGANAIVGAF